MRKLFFLILFCLVFGSSFAQCNLEYKKDQFNGLQSWATKYEVVSRIISGTLKISLKKYVEGPDTTLRLNFELYPAFRACVNSESQILLKSGDNVITVNLIDRVDCASQGSLLVSGGIMNQEAIQTLSQSYIDGIRVSFTEGYQDYVIKNNKDYFIKNLPCFK